MHPKYTPEVIDRFERKVDRSGTCHLWLAGKAHHGYGWFWLGKRNEIAPRVAWEIAHGPIPDGLIVCHNCPGGDNPACVNVSHLFLGTHLTNAQDRTAKGRSATGERSGARLHPEAMARGDRHGFRLHPETIARGTRNGNAKLTADQACAIYRRAHAGAVCRALAREFGVSANAVHSIKNGLTWRHVTHHAPDRG